ncbi:general transcription factor IIH subunit 3 [Hyalella azteca]|uniref:General transcription factor IIH subunit 3 n=1 Tax=Hyalella azteca TaxID=294128 RepID=A0A8B7NFS1_HYAAZ|nr:general transcription factor IIH subunit 3 [Hyalella azteca]
MSLNSSNLEGPANLLAIVVDIPPHLMLLECGPHHYLNSVLAFANLHLGASVNRKLCIVAATHTTTEFLYPPLYPDDQRVRQKDGRLEQLQCLDECVEKRLKELMLHQHNPVNGQANGCSSAAQPPDSLLSGAMGRALLFLRRHIGSSKAASNTARMLVLKVAGESVGQYLNYINVYLTAQKLGVPVDVCCLMTDCGLLQQGADITGGYYHKLTEPQSLLQTLVVLFSLGSWGGGSGKGGRSGGVVALPPPDTVDYRAACFCHRALVNMANVCSNCLSVYCKTVPLCSTCNVFFPIEMPMKRPAKKRR